MENLDLTLDWLIKRQFAPELEVFSGEPFFGETGFRVLHRILDKFEFVDKKPPSIVIPTNYTFILHDELTQKVEECLEKGKARGIPIILSASIDGKYCEANRPFRRGNDGRDDAYYDRVFAFNKKWGFSFHPMIYSQHISSWQANFLWFQEMLRKHDIPWSNIYLLEVRNAEWTLSDIEEYGKFIQFLTRWAFDMCQRDKKQFIDFIFKTGFNTLRSIMSTVGRGLGCSIQSTFHLRLGDLAIVPCHRLSYSPFITGHLEVENHQVVGVKAHNVELYLAIESIDGKNMPFCETCLVRSLCSLCCLGSNFETTGDLFSPIPSVCQLEHHRVKSEIDVLKDLGVLGMFLSKINPEKAQAIEHILTL
jgi:radical SAM protein with 4Fe4S-binding SPASM domain